jgi:tetratricopeptide (TPR) repeat protein
MFTLQVRCPGAADREWLLNPGRYRIGRAADAEIQLLDNGVSSWHCELEITSDGVIVRDLGSTNGTYINGQLIREATLRAGQWLTVGASQLILTAPAAAAEIRSPRDNVRYSHPPTAIPQRAGAALSSSGKRPTQGKRTLELGIVAAVLAAVAAMVGVALSLHRGHSVVVKNYEILYERPVLEIEARKVAEFLVENEVKRGEQTKLTKSGQTYVLKLVFKNSVPAELGDRPLEQIAFELSETIVKRAPVEIHLGGSALETVKIVKPDPSKEKLHSSLMKRRLGLKHMELGEYNEAIGALQEAISALPRNVPALITLGHVYVWHTHQPVEAIEVYERALRLRPDLKDADLLYGLAYAYVSAGTNQATAVRLAEAALKLKDDEWTYAHGYAVVAFKSGRHADALKAFEHALRKEPYSGIWYMVAELARSRIGPDLFLPFCDQIKEFTASLDRNLVLADFYRSHGQSELAVKAEEEAKTDYAALGLPLESAWMVIGPFDNPNNTGLSVAFPPEQEFNLPAGYPGKAGLVKWQRADDGREDGRLNFGKLFTTADMTVAYAAMEINSPADQKVELRIGSDDQVKVWLNGQVVWTFSEDRPLRMDQDKIPVKLRQGKNRLLCKVTQGGGDWELMVRITDSQGQLVPDLTYQEPSSSVAAVHARAQN